MEIRPLSKTDDRYAVSRVYEESWKKAYKDIMPQSYLDGIPPGKWVEALDNPEWHSLIMLDGGQIIGTAAYCASRFSALRGYGELVSLYLLPEYFGRGYGTKLLNAALAGLSDLGYKDIFLWVLEENLRAVHFYEKYGFRKSGAYLDDTVGGRILRERQYIYYGIRPRPFP